MSQTEMKTPAQLRKIFALGKNLGLTKDILQEMAGKRLSELTKRDANELIEILSANEQEKASSKPRDPSNVIHPISWKQRKYISDLQKKLEMSDEQFKRICQKMIKADTPLTAKNGRKVIKALRSMVERGYKGKASGE